MDQAILARLKELKAGGEPKLASIDLDALAAGSLNPGQILEAIIAILTIFFSNNPFVIQIIALLQALVPIFGGGSGTIPRVRLDKVGLGPTPYSPW